MLPRAHIFAMHVYGVPALAGQVAHSRARLDELDKHSNRNIYHASCTKYVQKYIAIVALSGFMGDLGVW